MKNNGKEFSELMKAFERTAGQSMSHQKESREFWAKGYYYAHAETNKLFIGFLHGYQHAKSMARLDALPLDE